MHMHCIHIASPLFLIFSTIIIIILNAQAFHVFPIGLWYEWSICPSPPRCWRNGSGILLVIVLMNLLLYCFYLFILSFVCCLFILFLYLFFILFVYIYIHIRIVILSSSYFFTTHLVPFDCLYPLFITLSLLSGSIISFYPPIYLPYRFRWTVRWVLLKPEAL